MICPRCGTSNVESVGNCVQCGAALVPVSDAETFGGVSTPPLPSSANATSVPRRVPVTPDASNAPTAGPWATGAAPGAQADLVDFGPRYCIERMLGEGGMGAVYKAFDKELERSVALKLIRPGLALDAAVAQRFKQELLLASKVSHKNILRIHDLGEAAGVKFISMAYVEGEDLHQLLSRQGKLPLDRALNIARQLCAALHAAHSEGVVHRDFKPQNILLDKSENVYVSDFGLAKSLEHDTGMTRSGEFLGTPRYMAPEQVEGKKIDHRVDLYALGLILYEMVTGDVPFHADSTLQLMYKRVHEAPKHPKSINPDLPDWIVKVIMKSLERDPDQRYQDAAAILRDLEATSAPVGSRTVQITVPKVMGSGLRVAAAASVVAMLLVIATVFIVRNRQAAPTAKQHAPVSVLVADFQNTTNDAVFDGTLEPAFSVALEGASFVTAYSRGNARKLAARVQPGAAGLDAAVARLVASREGINVVLSGAIEAQGAGYRITAEALDGMSGSKLYSGEMEANKKEAVLPVVGKLAAKIRGALGDTTPESVQVAAAETFTTTSLAAAHEYALAQESQWVGKWQEATEHYLKATAADPNMGRAYSGLAVLAYNTGHLQDAEKYFKLALSNIDRMSDREKFRTRGTYYLSIGNLDKGIEELSQLVKQYPADTAGHSNLALAYSWRRDWPQALETARRSIEVNPKGVLQHSNYGFYLIYAGKFDEAIKAQKKSLEINPAFVRGHMGIAIAQLAQGNVSDALQSWQELAKLGGEAESRAASGMADVALYEGRLNDGVAILEEGIAADLAAKNPDSAALKLVTLAHAQVAAGRDAPARAALGRALAASHQANIQFWAARDYVDLGDENKALALAKELANQLGTEQRADAKLIEGEVELKRGRIQAAIQHFQEAQKILDTWLGHFDLGRAYIEAGAFAEAGSEIETCLKRRGEAAAALLDEEPTYYLFPAVHYYLGRAQEGLKSSEAPNSYKQFLTLQPQGQGPLVADARRRLNH